MVLSIIDIYNVVKNFVTVTLLFIKLEEQSKEKKRQPSNYVYAQLYTNPHLLYVY